MVNRQKLTLRKPTPADPIKIAMSIKMGFRYVDRNGRYIAQAMVDIGQVDWPDHTWVDIPLVPETYGEAS